MLLNMLLNLDGLCHIQATSLQLIVVIAVAVVIYIHMNNPTQKFIERGMEGVLVCSASIVLILGQI